MNNFSSSFLKVLLVIIGIDLIYNAGYYSGVESERDYEANPIVLNPSRSDCSSTGITQALCKSGEYFEKILDEAKKKKEILDESRANPNNQYSTIEECLSDNTEMIEYTSRDEWCDSRYVQIINFDILLDLDYPQENEQ